LYALYGGSWWIGNTTEGTKLIPRDVGYLTAETGGVAVTAVGVVRPFLFAANWNGKLSRALGK
jgi:hypothetical protein